MKDIKIGDLVRIINEWTVHNPWMKFEDELIEIGLVVKDFGHNNHHCVVLIGGKEMNMSKTKLEVVCK
jgi:hypothetical protein